MSSIVKFCIVVTHVMQVLLFAVLIFFGYHVYESNIMGSKRNISAELFDCDNRISVKETSQYSDYWVLWNFVKPELRLKSCSQALTYAIQGNPSDIYYLETLFAYTMRNIRVSFAVYVNSSMDMENAIDAMHYVHSCVYFTDTTDSLVRLQNIFARDHVAFHLYFQHRLLDHISVPTNIDYIINQPLNCAKRSQHKPVTKSNINDTTLRHVIIGKNIAQLATESSLLLHLDSRTWPISDMFTVFLKEVALFNSWKDVPPFQNVIFRLPTLIIKNIPESSLTLRSFKHQMWIHLTSSSINLTTNMGFDTIDFILNNNSYPMYRISSMLPFLVRRVSYFITHFNAPLYDDRFEMSLLQSEHLRLLRFAWDDAHVVVLHQTFVLHNATSDEVTLDGVVKSRYNLDTLDQKLRDEYQRVYRLNKL